MNNVNNNPNVNSNPNDPYNQVEVTIKNKTGNKTVLIPHEIAATLFRAGRTNASTGKLNSKIKNIDISNNNNNNDNSPAGV